MKTYSRLAWPVFAVLLFAASAVAQNAPLRLTLQEAIERGLQANLGVLMAETRSHEAAGTVERRQSLLEPRVHIETPVALQNRSLAAMGISIPHVPLPQVTRALSTYDARAYADQPLLDLQALHALRSARLSASAARSDYQDARDLVVRSVADIYLAAQSQFADAAAAASRVDTAEALCRLAVAQRDSGVATGIDVLRAQVQLANEQQSLVQARDRAKGTLLSLARAIGISPGTAIELADPLEYHPAATAAIDSVLPQALAARPDYQSLLRQRSALNEQFESSRARSLPKLLATGNYGGIGRNPGSIRPTGAIQVEISMTVFDRDRQGEQSELQARIHRLDRQLDDARLGVEQELRQALLDLDSAAEEVRVAGAGLELAVKELDLAQLRFSQGVTNNIEVTTAQDSLARAQQNRIVALTHHADARIAMVRALGNTEASYLEYLGSR